MRAYTCKITLRGSKPPCWWRCSIPEGISFSSLSIVLDQLIGIEPDGPFSFEIHQFARVWEPTAENPLHTSYYHSAYDAAHTAVDTLLKTGKLINYLRKDQVYQIRVESEDDRYPFSYPLVLKSPRGTDNFALLKKLQDGILLEEREMKRPRSKEQMLAQAKKGVVRLPRVPQFTDQDSPYRLESSSALLQRMAGQLRELFKDLPLLDDDQESGTPRRSDEGPEEYTLREILDFYNENDLEEVAKHQGIPLNTKDTKEDRINRIAEKLLDPDVLYRHFLSLTDAEIAVFEDTMSAGGILKFPPEKEDDIRPMDDAGYVFYSIDDEVIIATEIMEAYRKISTPEFHARRKKVSYLRQCLMNVVPVYYSLLPIRKFTRICRRSAEPQIRADEVPELLALIPDSLHDCVIREDTIYASEIIRDSEKMQYIRSIQGDKPYYIMKEDEIDEILQYEYPRSRKSYRNFRDYLITEMKVDPDKAEEVLKPVHRLIALSYRMQKFFDTLKEHDIIPTEKQANELAKHFMALMGDTRTVYNRGYTPQEMSAIQGDKPVRNIGIDETSITIRK